MSSTWDLGAEDWRETFSSPASRPGPAGTTTADHRPGQFAMQKPHWQHSSCPLPIRFRTRPPFCKPALAEAEAFELTSYEISERRRRIDIDYLVTSVAYRQCFDVKTIFFFIFFQGSEKRQSITMIATIQQLV